MFLWDPIIPGCRISVLKTKMLLWPKLYCFSWILETDILYCELVINVVYDDLTGPCMGALQCSREYKKFHKSIFSIQLFIHATITTNLWSQQCFSSWSAGRGGGGCNFWEIKGFISVESGGGILWNSTIEDLRTRVGYQLCTNIWNSVETTVILGLVSVLCTLRELKIVYIATMNITWAAILLRVDPVAHEYTVCKNSFSCVVWSCDKWILPDVYPQSTTMQSDCIKVDIRQIRLSFMYHPTRNGIHAGSVGWTLNNISAWVIFITAVQTISLKWAEFWDEA